jgi:hypothetical protein
MEYISLGGSCSVAYQLQINKLRDKAYPFDWVRISFNSVLKLLENNFNNFFNYSDYEIIRETNKFPYIKGDNFIDNKDSNYIVKHNYYNIKFYHDFIKNKNIEDQFNNFTLKYKKRIHRLFEIIKSNNKIIFIRDELKVNSITNDNIKTFNLLIHKINPLLDYKFILIIHNPKNKIINIKTNNKIKIINDTKLFEDWKRPNIKWKEILLEYKMNEIKYPRQKIVYNPNNSIVKLEELNLDNNIIKIINYIKKIDITFIETINIQITSNNKIGIKLIIKNYENQIMDIFNYIHNIYNIDVFCYCFYNNKNKIVYITEKKYLEENFNDIKWFRSIESFSQVNNFLSNKLHKDLITYIDLYNKDMLLTIGGECGYYSILLDKFYKKINCITNSSKIYNDCLYNKKMYYKNKFNIHNVNYDNINIHKFNDYKYNNNTMIVNIGKKGLKERLCKQILDTNYNQILYIGCCEKYIIHDYNILKNKYKINNIMKYNFFSNNKYYVYLLNLTIHK